MSVTLKPPGSLELPSEQGILFAGSQLLPIERCRVADEQEVMAAMANIIIETYAMECAALRAQKLVESRGEAACALPIAMTQVYLAQAMDKIEAAARKVTAAVAEGDMLRTQMAIVRRLSKYEPFNTIAARQTIANRIIEAGKYVLA